MKFSPATTAHIHRVDLTHAQGAYHHLCAVHTEKHTCTLQKYTVCHHFIQLILYHITDIKNVIYALVFVLFSLLNVQESQRLSWVFTFCQLCL